MSSYLIIICIFSHTSDRLASFAVSAPRLPCVAFISWMGKATQPCKKKRTVGRGEGRVVEQVKRPNKKLPRPPIIQGLVVSVLMVRYETDYIVWSAAEYHTDFLKSRKSDVTVLF